MLSNNHVTRCRQAHARGAMERRSGRAGGGAKLGLSRERVAGMVPLACCPTPGGGPRSVMNLVELSLRIRQARIDRGLTLDHLATRIGMTRSWLSKVENFRITPSLQALAQISEALEVPLSRLLAEAEERSSRLVLVRAGEGREIRRDGGISDIGYESLAHSRTDRAMDPFMLTLPSGKGRDKPLPHEGEEFLIVIGGQVEFEYNGTTLLLNEGDSLYFDATTPHRLMNRSENEARVLCVFLTGSKGVKT